MADQLGNVLAGGRIPNPRRPIYGAGDHAKVVRAERSRSNLSSVALKDTDGLAGVRVPQARGGIVRRRYDEPSIRAEGSRPHGSFGTLQSEHRFVRLSIPEAGCVIGRCGDDTLAVC